MTDEQLVADILAGQRQQFQQLYETYLDRIYAFVFFRTSHRETAEDLTSVIFLKALDRLAQFSGGSFRGWLYTIARTTLIDHYRTNRPADDIETKQVMVDEDHDGRVDARLALEKVQDALKHLPDEQREIVILRVWDDLPYAEISRLLGKSEAACKMSFSRSISQLKSLLALLAMLALIKSTHGIPT